MLKDGHIRLLPVHVANKIAAGEVVERPASVVKELMENAIDAKATRIDVVVTAGGRKLIEIRDNGCGMSRDDALMSIERQATSKIRDVDDIEHIDTLGFRGEALPSIASVARFILKTRRAESDAGTELVVLGGTLQDVRDAGVPPGTTIEVRDLFFNVPARRKFLRTFQTEQTHIRSMFVIHALAHPRIGMSLTADSRAIYRLVPDSTLAERIRDLFGPDFCADLREVDYTHGALRVYGFVSLPHQTRTDSSEQYVFINGRPATAPVIAYALREAYPPLERNRKPIVLLFLELPPEQVDVNVHPTKREVRFHKPVEVREALIRAISGALGTGDSAGFSAAGVPEPDCADTPDVPECAEPVVAVRPESPACPPVARTVAARAFPYPAAEPAMRFERPVPAAPTGRGLLLFPERERAAAPDVPPHVEQEAAAPADARACEIEGAPWKWFRILGQLTCGYILLETNDGYVTLDPKAALERILFEELMAPHPEGVQFAQPLLLPETIQLPPADAARLRNYLAVLQQMGFGVDAFGASDHFVVESLPQLLGDVQIRELLGNIAHDLEHAGVRRGAEKWREEVIAKAACRTAVGTRTLAPQEIDDLVRKLSVARMPYTCPRGKPTMILTSIRELDRKFGK